MQLSTASATLPADVPNPNPSGRRPLLTPIPSLPDEYLLVIDHSSLEKFITCPTAARNYLVLGREARGRNAPLVFGGAVHAGIEAFLLGKNEIEQNQAITNHYASNPLDSSYPDYRTPAVAVDVLRHYRQRSYLPDYAWKLLTGPDNLPLVERAFELPIGVLELDCDLWTATGPVYVRRLHVAWSGRTDAIAECFGKRCIVDHKTTSVLTSDYIQSYVIASQTIGYVWAAQQLWPDLSIDHFCLNVIYLKKPTATGGYERSLVERGPRGGEPPLMFQRHYFPYSPSRVSQWVANTLAIVSDFVHCLARNQFPMHTAWCTNKFGLCPYYTACSQDNPDVRLNVLQSGMFADVTWNPVR